MTSYDIICHHVMFIISYDIIWHHVMFISGVSLARPSVMPCWLPMQWPPMLRSGISTCCLACAMTSVSNRKISPSLVLMPSWISITEIVKVVCLLLGIKDIISYHVISYDVMWQRFEDQPLGIRDLTFRIHCKCQILDDFAFWGGFRGVKIRENCQKSRVGKSRVCPRVFGQNPDPNCLLS